LIVALALRLFDAALAAHLVPADRLEHEPRRARLPTGLRGLDAALGGGWPAAALAELCGRRSAGRTSVLHASLAAAIAREQTVALVDAAGAFDPRSAAAAGVHPARLLWIRAAGTTGTGRLALQAADVLIAAGGFGLVVIDFGEETPRAPTAAWLRLRHAAERQGTTALVVARGRTAGAVATAAINLHSARPHFVTAGGPLLAALETRVAVERAIGHSPSPANDAPPLRFSIR
jgi:recA bacterial DNA recombination protein